MALDTLTFVEAFLFVTAIITQTFFTRGREVFIDRCTKGISPFVDDLADIFTFHEEDFEQDVPRVRLFVRR